MTGAEREGSRDGRTRLPANVAIGKWHTGGHLEIAPGELAVEAWSVARKPTSQERIVQRELAVTMICARVALPWINTSVIIRDGSRTGVATFWGFARPRLRRLLAEAGFQVREKATWFDVGYSAAKSR
jgi:hypothetical protein